MKKTSPFILSIIGCELVGLAATPFTVASIPTWYRTLQKPFFTPPNWLFGPAWTLLYALMGGAIVLIWNSKKSKARTFSILVFFLQLALNFTWSIMFFGLRSPLYGFINILILWAAIFLAIIRFYRVSKVASFLMIPYILWVSFATALNFSIMLLNP